MKKLKNTPTLILGFVATLTMAGGALSQSHSEKKINPEIQLNKSQPSVSVKTDLPKKIAIQPTVDVLKNAVQLSISKNSISANGMSFPKISRLEKNSSACCEVGQTRTIPGGSFLHDGLRRMKKTWNHSQEVDYFSPSCWMTDYGVVNLTTHGTPASYSTSKLAHNLNFNTNSDYSFVLSTMNSYVLALDVPDVVKADLSSKLEEFISSYQSMGYNLSSSHGGFRVSTIVHGTGRLNTTTAHSWIHGNFTVTETCCPPEFTSRDDLLEGLKSWTNETVSNIPYIGNLPSDVVPQSSSKH